MSYMRAAPKKEKKMHIEMIRIFAIFWVIYIHTSYTGYALFLSAPSGSFRYWLYMVISIVSKSAVPLFFAISGAVLLNRENEPLSRIWRVRIPKIVVCLVFFSAFYYVVIWRDSNKPMSFKNFIQSMYQGKINSHLWYLYAYLFILILLPFFRALVQNIKTGYFYYLLGIVLITGAIIPILEYVFMRRTVSMDSHISFSIIRVNYVFYPILGYFLEHRISDRVRKTLLPITFFTGVLLTWMVSYATNMLVHIKDTGKIGDAETFFGIAAYSLVPFFYLMFKALFSRGCPKTVSFILNQFGCCTMGVYLIHIYFMRYTSLKTLPEKIGHHISSEMAVCLLFCLIIFLISTAISWIWRKIPLLKVLLGG